MGGILGIPKIKEYVFKVSHKVFRLRMQNRKYRPLYYVGQQPVLDLFPCVDEKPDYLVWLLMKLSCAMRKLRVTTRRVAVQDIRMSTDKVLTTLPGVRENVLGMQFRQHLMRGTYHLL